MRHQKGMTSISSFKILFTGFGHESLGIVLKVTVNTLKSCIAYADIIRSCLVYDGVDPMTKEISHRPTIDDVISMLNAWKV